MNSSLDVIAHIHNGFTTKFGIPRQSGLVNNFSKIIFTSKYRDKNALNGIEEFSHLWLIWGFSKNKNNTWSPTVRPPRLGGNKRVGVFATRSPYRPNQLGLSSVKLENVLCDGENGYVLLVSGADLLDGTPIYDIKPYLPFTDNHPDAFGGFADTVKDNNLTVVFLEEFKEKIDIEDIDHIIKILEGDPRPHYHDDSRVYAFEYSKYHIEFKVTENILTVTDLTEIKEQ